MGAHTCVFAWLVPVFLRYARAAELSKQRDLLAAWERDGHLKNLNKLKALGPAAMREYLGDTLGQGQTQGETQAAAAHSARASSMTSVKLSKMRPALGQTDALRSGRLSSRPGTGMAASVGFDPRA
jgi:hypothetical protein